MKKLFLTLLLTLPNSLTFALPVGNPADASLLCDGLFWDGNCYDPCAPCVSWRDAWSIRFGYYGDYNWNRHMELDLTGHADIETTQIYTNAGYLAFNLCDRFDLFTTLGATSFFINTNSQTFNASGIGTRLDIQSETAFSWSVGARATLWQCGCTILGIEGQYFSTCPHITRITEGSIESIYPNDITANYHEWQVGIGISHRINMFVPYVAIKASGSHLSFEGNTTLADPLMPIILTDLQNQRYFGYAIGVTLVDCEKASLCVEGRWPDEKALYVNGQIRF